ncbi:hypothetical protein SARC_03014 [Sphaeroforma arctica JP610]|uniref:Uncharacterized protein n=1 Tax=Sphaeroforma arctica JP610 TaxID=667725 RepID=A0A0L0G6W7_9EUKA|nr:hypothetical protein SARC_03014 [Sphaeroforma arctica JP610]KNC84772.1 hypothetical protein SARC_03014 [Sphaeroforma arctica JP610]|eukprot:XP_014158674.1 hypothetical protein SARC_03014 [Sphaeroforma arctica JP610]
MVVTPMAKGLFALKANAFNGNKDCQHSMITGYENTSTLNHGEQTYTAQHEFTPNASSDSLFSSKIDADQSTLRESQQTTSRFASTLRFVSALFGAAEIDDETEQAQKNDIQNDITSSTVSMYKSVTIRPIEGRVNDDGLCSDDVFLGMVPSVDTELHRVLYRFSAGGADNNKTKGVNINTISSGSCSDMLDRLSLQKQPINDDKQYRAPMRQCVKSRQQGTSGSKPSRSTLEHNSRYADHEQDVKETRRFFMDVKYTPIRKVEQNLPSIDDIELNRAVEDEHISKIRHLIQERKISIEANGKSQPLLCLAVQKDSLAVVEELIIQGADPNCVWQEKTCIYMAYTAGRIDMMRALLRAGAIPEMAKSKMRLSLAQSTLLYKAVEEGNVQAASVILPFIPSVNVGKSGRSIVHAAANIGSCEMMKALHEGAASKGEKLDYNTRYCDETVLIQAARGGHLELLSFLLEGDKVAVNDKDESGRTALHHAAAKPDSLESVQLLLDAGADTKILDNNGRTAQRMAAIHKHEAVIDLFERMETTFPEVSLMMLARHALKRFTSTMKRDTVCANLPSEVAKLVLNPLHEQLSA